MPLPLHTAPTRPNRACRALLLAALALTGRAPAYSVEAATPTVPTVPTAPAVPTTPSADKRRQTPRRRIPVRWHAWGAEAFAEAKRRALPVFLFLNASWSRRGRGMREQVFTQPDIAGVLNELFVPVYVDRDRRPGVDRRYQQAARALSGSTGWPLSLFLTPQGEAIYAGKFHSAEDDYIERRPGLRSILQSLAETWRKRRAKTTKEARRFEQELRRKGRGFPAANPAPADLLSQVAVRMNRALDPVSGGFGYAEGSPKFPTPRLLELALVHYARTGGAQSLAAVTRTLSSMIRGGLYDRLGGGFHRHALDRRWRRPRFEKTLALNAEMLALCVHAWQMTGEERYAEAARKTLGWLHTTLAERPRGGFLASQAGGDGSYYGWTSGEIEAAIHGAAACEMVRALYEVGEWGDLPERAPHRNILYEVLSREEAAKRAGIAPEQTGPVLQGALADLRAARRKRRPPPLDRTILVDANARAISASLLAAAALGDEAARAFALRSLDRLLREAVDPQRGAAHFLDTGARHTPHFLFLSRDEAALAVACTDAFLATGRERYREAARAAVARLQQRFLDPKTQTYLDRAPPAKAPRAPPALGRLADPDHPFQDAPMPSANALAVLAQLRLAALTEDEKARAKLRAQARKTLDAFGRRLIVIGGLGPSLVLDQDAAQHGFIELRVYGKAQDEGTRALLAAAEKVYAPHLLIRRLAPKAEAARPEARIRVGGRTSAKLSDPRKLRPALEQAGRR